MLYTVNCSAVGFKHLFYHYLSAGA